MASSKEYLEFILEQLAELDEITFRAMMGEYIIYYRGKIVGGIYDDRLLVKPIKSAISFMPTVTYELPYDGAKEMLLVEDVDNKDIQVVHQRHTGDHCLPRSRHHHGVRHTHGHQQKLLDDQGKHEPGQLLIGKQGLCLFDLFVLRQRSHLKKSFSTVAHCSTFPHF